MVPGWDDTINNNIVSLNSHILAHVKNSARGHKIEKHHQEVKLYSESLNLYRTFEILNLIK